VACQLGSSDNGASPAIEAAEKAATNTDTDSNFISPRGRSLEGLVGKLFTVR
jgi:hypothetical protein